MRLFVCALLAVLTAATASATLVTPLSLDELVARADLVFEGTVIDVRPQWRETRGDRVIMSNVTFRVAQGFKGNLRQQVVLEMFGGTIGKDTMRIAGFTPFVVGDHDLVFARLGDLSGLPLVGLMQGRFKIAPSPLGHQMVTTFDGRTITDVASIKSPPRAAAFASGGMTLPTFASEITQRVARAGQR